MRILVFEDHQVAEMYPITLARPAFDVVCGVTRLVDLVKSFNAETALTVRSYLQNLTNQDFPWTKSLAQWTADFNASPEPVLFINARLVPSQATLSQLKELAQGASSRVLYTTSNQTNKTTATGSKQPASIGAVYFTPTDLTLRNVSFMRVAGWLGQEVTNQTNGFNTERRHPQKPIEAFDYGYQVIENHIKIFGNELSSLLQKSNTNSDLPLNQIREQVFVGPNVQWGEHIVTDTSNGPILIENNCEIGHFSYLKGPLYVGRNSKISPRSSILGNVMLSHTTKVGGEVEHSIIEKYSNKAHDGFLGHSYVGRWVNIGAGTNVSNLKSTYGPVRVLTNTGRLSSGMQFLGTVLGDYSKAAIHTAVFTGFTVGVGSMVCGIVNSDVPSFVNYAQNLEQIPTIPLGLALKTQQRMFERRDYGCTPLHKQLLHDIFQLTMVERNAFSNKQTTFMTPVTLPLQS